MALQKEKEVKGYIADYWKITSINLDLMTATLMAKLSLFKNRDTRNEGTQNTLVVEEFSWTIPEEFSIVATMSVYEMVAYVYSKIKESRIEQRPKLNEDGEIIWEDQNEGIPEMEDYEANWFADSVPILEEA